MDAADKATLRRRAALLARAPLAADTGERIDVVEFLLGRERYGLAAAHVCEVLPLKDFSPVPCTPPFVVGIMNVRGQIVTVLNIGKFFDLPDSGITDLNKVLLIETAAMKVGVLADAILGTRTVRVEELQTSLPTLAGLRAEFLRGVTPDRLIVLHAAKFLADDAILVREEVAL